MDSVAGEERPGLQRNPPNKAGILTFISLWDWTLSPPHPPKICVIVRNVIMLKNKLQDTVARFLQAVDLIS